MSRSPSVQHLTPLYLAAQVRALDRAVIAGGLPGGELMLRAATAALVGLRARWPRAQRILVLCGIGNNGGDGYVLARLAREQGLSVRLMQIGDATRLQGDAQAAAVAWRDAGGVTEEFDAGALAAHEVIVDGLFGTGLDRPLAAPWLDVIAAVNAAGRPVLALDIPSGLHADSGAPLPQAIRAELTVSFIALKPGLFTGQGVDHCGRVELNDLGVQVADHPGIPPAAACLDAQWLRAVLPRRARSAHKGHCGHVLVVGGDHGMSGAVQLAASAAARTGAGLVSVATRAAHAPLIAAAQPELMCHGVETPAALAPLLARASVVAIGPGLGQSDWARSLLGAVLDTQLPLVVDADALNLIAADPVTRQQWIVTPHPGEAARLLQTAPAEVQRDRLAATRAIAGRYGAVTVLKGAGSIIDDGRSLPRVCGAGNPGMASGGMGDVLTGIIAALWAQGLAGFDAASAGVLAHALAADAAAQQGERGLLASDVIAALRGVVNAGFMDA